MLDLTEVSELLNLANSRASKPRVAMVVAGDVFGGAERQVVALCDAGSSLFACTVFTTLPGPVATYVESRGITCRAISGPPGALGRVVRQLRGHLGRRNYDIVHTHGYRSSVIAALAAGRHIPAVRTVHGAPEGAFLTKVGLYEALGRAADRWVDAHLVFVSHDLASRRPVRSRQSVIHNGIDLPTTFPDRPAQLAGDRFNLVAVGRLDPVKGLGHLIQAMSHPSLRCGARLHLIGDGPERAALQNLVDSLQLSGNVIFHGFQSNAVDFIAHADALVMSSLHEGIPYVLLEALAAGTPVIATRVGGIPEIIRDGVDGLLVPPASADALATAVLSLRNSRALCEGLRSAGPLRVESEFSAKAMAIQYAKLYSGMMRA